MIQVQNLSLKKKIPEISKLDLHIEPGECFVLLSSGENALNHLINIFSGLERDFQGSVKIDGESIRHGRDGGANRLTNLTALEQWPPDLKVGGVISFFKKRLAVPEEEFEDLSITLNLDSLLRERISDLETIEWRRILFSLARLKKSRNYIFRDFVKGMPLEFNLEFKTSIRRLKETGCSILYLSDDVFFAPEIGDRIGFLKKGKLLLEIKADRLRRMNIQEIYFQFLSEK